MLKSDVDLLKVRKSCEEQQRDGREAGRSQGDLDVSVRQRSSLHLGSPS